MGRPESATAWRSKRTADPASSRQPTCGSATGNDAGSLAHAHAAESPAAWGRVTCKRLLHLHLGREAQALCLRAENQGHHCDHRTNDRAVQHGLGKSHSSVDGEIGDRWRHEAAEDGAEVIAKGAGRAAY